MSMITMEMEEFFNLGDPLEKFDFMDTRYLYTRTSEGELRDLLEELTH